MCYVHKEHGWENFPHKSCRHVGWKGFLCCLLIIATGSERNGLKGDISKMQTDKWRKMGYVYHSWQGFSVLCSMRWFRFQGNYCIGVDWPEKPDLASLISVCSVSRISTIFSCCRWTIQCRVLKLIEALIAHHWNYDCKTIGTEKRSEHICNWTETENIFYCIFQLFLCNCVMV